MDKKIAHIGKLTGKVLVFGGVYSNLQALEKLKSIASTEGIAPENCICTGDIIGYCAQPEETIQFLKKWGSRSITGNVENQLQKGAEDCGCDFKKGSRCDGFSQLWYSYAQRKLSKNALDFIGTIPDYIQFNYNDKTVLVVHGSFFNTSEFIFKSTPWKTKQDNFEATKSTIIIAGHCGLPFHQENQNNIWINPGVIGMPANDGSSKVWYAILDNKNDAFSFSHHSFHYNHKLTSDLMNENNLPKEYAQTIISGIWDNTEILPSHESSLQGLKIKL